jgi:N-acyl-L-homoserine lactone synthetase
MIIVVDGLNRDEHTDLLREMFKLRARVFDGRLGWDVVVRNGEERDIYDTLDPAYLISVDVNGAVVGCLRVLQTTGPHMLADVFAPLLDGQPPLRSARLWEATRFCVDTDRLRDRSGANSISTVTSELMIGACEYAMAAGVDDAVAVIDPIMHRILKRSGNGPSDYLGVPRQMGKVVAMAVLMDCSAERVARIREFSGLHGVVFAPADATPVAA